MSLIDTREAVFSPSYKIIRIHDYTLPDQPGHPEALDAAYQDQVAASDFAVMVVCAQDLLKVRLTVALHDAPTEVDTTSWDSTRRFALPFPSARLHAGDGFGEGIVMDLLDEGDYAVIVQYRGRDTAKETLAREWPQASELAGDDLSDYLNQWAGLEEYFLTLYPAER
ncbi:hypothetical protein [Krasilnikovia sp. M28-CT-15]|uniref:hypothetical protein n=1 Tax=Krasilnikovia sp. M28-CT-15 TaxID=3373540 RepID=UPI003876D5F7